jgi:hypothetical protein
MKITFYTDIVNERNLEPLEITQTVTKEMVDDIYKFMIPGKIRDLKEYFSKPSYKPSRMCELFVILHLHTK